MKDTYNIVIATTTHFNELGNQIGYDLKETEYPLSGVVVAIFLVASFFLIKSFIRK